MKGATACVCRGAIRQTPSEKCSTLKGEVVTGEVIFHTGPAREAAENKGEDRGKVPNNNNEKTHSTPVQRSITQTFMREHEGTILPDFFLLMAASVFSWQSSSILALVFLFSF